ncbi:hypothetical protein BKA63DRAFT_240060 [Paraphoma chrysanthemicola]|nr:hypothetical protein BKA63DRAFT_240060 [Paraphoma chrysanthemicola]
MASIEPIALRSGFLHEAAHLLAVSSPSASAFIGSARLTFIENANVDISVKEREALRRGTCGACGSLLIPGWSSRISSETQGKDQKKKAAKDTAAAKTNVVSECLRCHRKTEQNLQPQPRRKLRGQQKASATTLVTRIKPVVEDSKLPKTANASSKQRQKARKGGLQAMLEKNKTQNSSQGFDLMDFAM